MQHPRIIRKFLSVTELVLLSVSANVAVVITVLGFSVTEVRKKVFHDKFHVMEIIMTF
jgi:hypothetical protein